MGLFDFFKRSISSQRKSGDTGKRFPLFTGSGVCDVCNASLSGRTAYLVPNKVFYNSKKYREQQKNSPMAILMGVPMDDAYFSLMQAQDQSQGSAVCENCIHLFE